MEANGIVLSAQARSNQTAAVRSDVHLIWLLMSGASFFFLNVLLNIELFCIRKTERW